MQNQNIIMVCQQNWDLSIGSNAKNIAKEFSKNNRVLYINMPLDINNLLFKYKESEIKAKIRVLLKQENSLKQVATNLWIYTPDVLCLSINWLRWRSLFNKLNYFNSYLLAHSIKKVIEQLDFNHYYLIQDGLIFQGLELPNLLKPKKFIYYLRDSMTTMPYFQRHGSRIEKKILKQADGIATNSAYLADYALQYNSHTKDIGQGCVLSLYQADNSYTIPADLMNIPEPRIGYTGFLTSLRLDVELLLAIAHEYPTWHLVLVGPEDDTFCKSDLHNLPNVHFLGSKYPEQLPAYLNYFTVCINPQIINEITVANYPLKIDEYLAMGKPIVATHTKTMELFKQHVHLASTKNEWFTMLSIAVNNKELFIADESIRFAQSHTWEASVAKLAALLTNEN